MVDQERSFHEDDEDHTTDLQEPHPYYAPESDDDDLRSSLDDSPSQTSFAGSQRTGRRRSVLSHPSKPRSIRTPSSPMATTLPNNNLPSAPASPPTPAPSPSPNHRLPGLGDWSKADVDEEKQHRDFRARFNDAPASQKQRILAELINMCDSQMLTFVHNIVCPRLKKDPFSTLPNEICLRILSFVDHPRTLARAGQVSKRWHELINDDMAWKALCERHAYRKLSDVEQAHRRRPRPYNPMDPYGVQQQTSLGIVQRLNTPYATASAPDLTTPSASTSGSIAANEKPLSKRDKHMSYRSQFKRKYMVETAWRTGGVMKARQITPEHGVVTSLHLTDRYIIVALDNAKIHVFDSDGTHQKTLHGHMMGVWAMVPWGDILVSGGCDRDVRVWNMATGQSLHTLRGHSSTVRCLKMCDANTAITGSRDTTLRIWDIQKGFCKHVLVGHQASVRCLEVHGDLIASGSYDTTARIWSISEGKCLRVLHGHFSQIYAIAFDGKRVATGSLDTSVRIWDPLDGRCLAILQGHTSLVGQLQLRHSILCTGGSDGSVRVWSLETLSPIHRLAAHDNSVTSLQFNESRIISGGSDGRVKVWDLKTGTLIRELSQPAEAVWRVVFEEDKAVVMANRGQRTVMEVWSFAPPEEELAGALRSGSSTPMSLGLDRDRDDGSPSRSLLTSAFQPPPQITPPAPSILPLEFSTLSRQQNTQQHQRHSMSHLQQAGPGPVHMGMTTHPLQPQPYNPRTSHARLVPDDDDVVETENMHDDVDDDVQMRDAHVYASTSSSPSFNVYASTSSSRPNRLAPSRSSSGDVARSARDSNELTRQHSQNVPSGSSGLTSWLNLNG